MTPETVTPGRQTTLASRDRRGMSPRQPGTAETIPRQGGVVGFTQSLLHMSRARIELQAAGLRARRTSSGDDVAWWEATVALDRALRAGGHWHDAVMAAHLASQAVLAAATRTGLTQSPDVAAVAQSAGEVARVLVAGDLSTTGTAYLARGWEDLLRSPAERHSPSAPAGGRHHGEPRAAANQPRKGQRT
jgi:hypothetical protein